MHHSSSLHHSSAADLSQQSSLLSQSSFSGFSSLSSASAQSRSALSALPFTRRGARTSAYSTVPDSTYTAAAAVAEEPVLRQIQNYSSAPSLHLSPSPSLSTSQQPTPAAAAAGIDSSAIAFRSPMSFSNVASATQHQQQQQQSFSGLSPICALADTMVRSPPMMHEQLHSPLPPSSTTAASFAHATPLPSSSSRAFEFRDPSMSVCPSPAVSDVSFWIADLQLRNKEMQQRLANTQAQIQTSIMQHA